MIDLREFTNFIEEKYDIVSGVPCSYFKDFLSYLSNQEGVSRLKHIIATREDEAIAIAAGAALSNKRALVYMQNSGIGNIGDALTSLVQLYKLPMLLLISYRGLKQDIDFPEHSIMGRVNNSLLGSLNLQYWDLNEKDWKIKMRKALSYMDEQSVPVVLMVKKGVLSE